ncbi:hypothetical protein [Lentibacillus daqui]|uniref:hypothetical protein n=1 Tax=Lentibacillus daqui TaxID=2911514 RepID=UPI0022B0D393|nr:hypothetical protein [Lentibacillus daqui]
MSIYYRIILKFLLTVMGIVLAAALPALFDGLKLNVYGYIDAVESIVSSMVHPSTITYDVFEKTYSVFPGIWQRWEYSMILLVVASLHFFSLWR